MSKNFVLCNHAIYVCSVEKENKKELYLHQKKKTRVKGLANFLGLLLGLGWSLVHLPHKLKLRVRQLLMPSSRVGLYKHLYLL